MLDRNLFDMFFDKQPVQTGVDNEKGVRSAMAASCLTVVKMTPSGVLFAAR